MSKLVNTIILNVPRIGPSRPSAGTALVKSLLNDIGVINKLYDINIDFYNNFINEFGSDCFHSVDLYFYTENNKLSNEQSENYNKFIDTWIQNILSHQPQWILISVFTWQCQKFTRDLLKRLRPLTDANIVIGGQGMIKSENTSFNERPVFALEMLEDGLINYFIHGEAEQTLKELYAGNFNAPGINSNAYGERSAMDTVPFYDFSDHNIMNYHSGYPTGQLPLETSRGCVRSCVFCDWPVYAGGFRSKSGIRLFEEMVLYYKKYNVNNFYFNDSLINGDLTDFRQFNASMVEFYKRENLPDRSLKFSGMYIVRKPNQFKEEDFELLGRAGGDTLLIGVETGSDRVRKEMRKGFNSADLDFTMQMASKYGIKTYFLMIVGFPSETRAEFEETLDLLRRYQRYVADGTLSGINFGTTLTIGEGTPIYNMPEKFNLVGVNGDRPKDIFWMHKENIELTYKERILRRIEAQELAMSLGYTFWKGDDQLSFIKDKYIRLLNEN